MIVLAIHDGHDAGVCLLRDGKEVFVSSEERRVNSKNFNGVPVKSIDAVMKKVGVSARDIDMIAIAGRLRTIAPTRDYTRRQHVLSWAYSAARSRWATDLARSILPKLKRRKALMAHLASLGLDQKPQQAYDHHLTHAATAHFHKPWNEDTLVLTLDGAGDGLCATVNIGRGSDLQVVDYTTKYHSMPAWMYTGTTRLLGMRAFEHEYKVMGMAPYGQAEYTAPKYRKMFGVEGTQFRNYTGRVQYSLERYMAKVLYQQRFDNICGGVQLVFEELVTQWVKNCVAATGIRKIACAGGAFLNVKANKLIRELPECEAFYAYPASDDGGTPIGAAILGYRDLCKNKNMPFAFEASRSMYQGLDFSESEMEQAIRASGLPYERMVDAPARIADMLANQKIVARFDGREEIGPRALGNRTIMADPRDLRNIRKLNFAIKYRDFWMPFAASILEEDAPKYLKGLKGCPYYMIEAFDTNPVAEREIIAGMHPMDMTVRPQVVNELNPGYRDIIRAFKQRTGVGAVLNTSFNLHGFPIVGTPEIAIHTLKNSKLDALALGPFLVTRGDGNGAA